MKTIESRICFKKIERADLKKVHAWKNDRKLLEKLNAHPVKLSLSQVRSWLDRTESDPNQVIFGIYLSDEKTIIGVIRLMFIDWIHSHAEMGIYIGDKKQQGKGLGVETVSLIRDFAFEVLGLHKMYLKVAKSNTAAIKTYRACGLKIDGVLPDHFRVKNKFEDAIMMSVIHKR